MSAERATYLDSSAIVKLVVREPDLATATLLGASLGQLVTYDCRLASAARANGIKVVSPS